MTKITAALIGAGQRGADAYATYALEYPDEVKFVAVADMDPVRRDVSSRLTRLGKIMYSKAGNSCLQDQAGGCNPYLHAGPNALRACNQSLGERVSCFAGKADVA